MVPPLPMLTWRYQRKTIPKASFRIDLSLGSVFLVTGLQNSVVQQFNLFQEVTLNFLKLIQKLRVTLSTYRTSSALVLTVHEVRHFLNTHRASPANIVGLENLDTGTDLFANVQAICMDPQRANITQEL